MTRIQISNKFIWHGKYQLFLRVECVLVMFEHANMSYTNCFVLRFKRWHVTFNGKQMSFVFVCCQFDFFIVDKRMYSCSKCLDVVMKTSCCPYPTLLFSSKKQAIFLSFQPLPTVSVIPLVVGIFPTTNWHGQTFPERMV